MGSNEDSAPSSPWTTKGERFYGEVAGGGDEEEEDDDDDEPPAKRHKRSSASFEPTVITMAIIVDNSPTMAKINGDVGFQPNCDGVSILVLGQCSLGVAVSSEPPLVID